MYETAAPCSRDADTLRSPVRRCSGAPRRLHQARAWLLVLVLGLCLMNHLAAAERPEATGPTGQAGLTGPAASAPSAAVQPSDLQPVAVGVTLNGSAVADELLLQRETGGDAPDRFWIPEALAGTWRLRTQDRPQRQIGHRLHVALCGALDRCQFDEDGALLSLFVADEGLRPLHIGPYMPSAADAQPLTSTGLVLNYDLSLWMQDRPGLALMLEVRAFGPWGHGELRLAGLRAPGVTRRTLLQPLWQMDRPEKGWSLQAGAVALPDTVWTSSMALWGTRWGSNTGLAPEQTRIPLPLVQAAASRELRADVYIDGLFRQTASVPYGPYAVEVMPLYPGQGTVDLLTTDITGQKTRSTTSYYMAPQMLAPGARDWSLDLGLLASDNARLPGRNAPLVAGAAWREGLKPQLTARAQALVGRDGHRLALGADLLNPRWGVSTLGLLQQRVANPGGAELAGRAAVNRNGAWLQAGHEYLSRPLSLNLHLERALHGCGGAAITATTMAATTTGPLAERLSRPCQHWQAQISGPLAPGWSASAAVFAQRDGRQHRRSTAALSLRWQLGRHQLALNATQTTRADPDARRQQSLSFSWSMPLGRQVHAQVRAEHQADGQRIGWSLHSLPKEDSSLRWRAYGDTGKYPQLGGGLTWRGATTDWRMDAWAAGPGLRRGGLSLGANGAYGWFAGKGFAARRIDDAFVMVDVGLPNLPVLLDNRVVAHTNAEGWAVVHEARAWQRNTIGVDTSALPVQYAMPLDQEQVVPAGRSAALLRFDVSDGGIGVQVVDPAGQPLPRGTRVKVSSQRQGTAVTSRGEVFLERADRDAELEVALPGGGACTARYQAGQPLAEALPCRP